MHARCFKRNRVHVALAVLVSISVVGCATRPVSQTDPVAPRFDIEGTWSWVQDPWEGEFVLKKEGSSSVSYTHLRAHETVLDLVCRLLLEKKHKEKKKKRK